GNLEDTVTISKNAHGVEGSTIYLGRGENVKLRDLLYGLMLQSGNDAAAAIAEHIGGSVEGFADMMNDKALEIGAKNTHFTNPHGLQNDSHYTTAYDLALISAYAMKNPVFAQIVSTKYKKIPWEEKGTNRVLKNKNKILWDYEGGNGVKTGFTKNSGRCLVSAAKRNGMQLVCVVLRCPDMFPDSMKLMDYCFAKYEQKRIIENGKYAGFVPVENGLKNGLHAYCHEDFFYPLSDTENVEVKITLDDRIKAPVFRGMLIGRVEAWLDGKLIYASGLYAQEDIEANTFIYNLRRVLDGWNNAIIHMFDGTQ
ncbi:MAG: D-alanyl-D-alanine carboxypeptidase family protein, partial [Bacillota bacterium]|nr:D-alanyl-D-alanine carboxypeptidase family protein [Bacillota bacterium]